MKLWQAATSRNAAVVISKRQPAPDNRNPISRLFRPALAPSMGKFEVNFESLEEVVNEIQRRSPAIFALLEQRRRLIAQGRFQFQRLNNGRPGDYFGTPELVPLEQPWVGGTTAALLSRMDLSAQLMGNAYVIRVGDNLKVLRADWVIAVWTSETDEYLAGDAPDGKPFGFFYVPRQPGNYSDDLAPGHRVSERVWFFPASDVAHFAPIPDPLAHGRGMSWTTPLLEEIGAALDTTTYKAAFFRNGAMPKLIVQYDASIKKEQFLAMKELFEENHKGPWNAYSTLHLGGGATAAAHGYNLKDLDFSKITNTSEATMAAAAGIPPAVVGFEVGLQGSSLNAGNLQQLKRKMGEDLLIPLWDEMAACLEPLINVPDGGRTGGRTQLAIDRRDVAFLRDDATASAEVFSAHAQTVSTLITAGFTPDSVLQSVSAEDLTLLVGQHSGLYSVQLQPAGVMGADANQADTAKGTKAIEPAPPKGDVTTTDNQPPEAP